MHQSLLAIVQDNREFAGSSFDSFVNHSVELLSIIKERSEDAKMIHHFLSSFLAQLLYALNLPVLKFKDLSFDQMKDVMVSILDSPVIQKNLGTFRREKPQKTVVPQTPELLPKDRDAQFVSRIHHFIAECCGHIQSCSPALFSHQPLDTLMPMLSKNIFEKVQTIQHLRGVLADLYIRIRKDDCSSKDSIMKRDIESLAADTFACLENQFSGHEPDFADLVSLIPPDDLTKFRASELSPFECVTAELQKVCENQRLVEPFLLLADSILADFASGRQPFVPCSTEFNHFLARIEAMQKAAESLTPREAHPLVFKLITKYVRLVRSCVLALSSVSFAEAFSKERDEVSGLISMRTELSAKIEQLQKDLAERDGVLSDLRREFAAFISASRDQADEHRRQLVAVHEREIQAILQCYRQGDF
jgi:hypothetical protein